MSEELTTFPAILYSGLWVLKTLGILKKDFGSDLVKVVVLIIDVPPAFTLTIEKGDFKVELLKDVKKIEDVDSFESDGYICLPSDVLLGGVDGVLEGIKNNTVIIKGQALLYLGNIGAAF